MDRAPHGSMNAVQHPSAPMLRTLLRSLVLLLVGVLPLALAHCGSPMQTHEMPPANGTANVRPPVDPAIDRWFRETTLDASGTFVPGDVLSIEFQGLPEYDVVREIPPDGTLPLFRATVIPG